MLVALLVFASSFVFGTANNIQRYMTTTVDHGVVDCYYETLENGNEIGIGYQVVDGGYSGVLSIDFSVTSPSGVKVLQETNKPDSSNLLTVKESGDFKFCFDNTDSRVSKKTVFFEIYSNDVSDEIDGGVYAVDADEEALGAVENLVKSLKTIKDLVSQSKHIQDQLRTIELKDRSVAERNFEHVNFWSTFHVIIMIGAGLAQVLMIRGIFDDRGSFRKFMSL